MDDPDWWWQTYGRKVSNDLVERGLSGRYSDKGEWWQNEGLPECCTVPLIAIDEKTSSEKKQYESQIIRLYEWLKSDRHLINSTTWKLVIGVQLSFLDLIRRFALPKGYRSNAGLLDLLNPVWFDHAGDANFRGQMAAALFHLQCADSYDPGEKTNTTTFSRRFENVASKRLCLRIDNGTDGVVDELTDQKSERLDEYPLLRAKLVTELLPRFDYDSDGDGVAVSLGEISLDAAQMLNQFLAANGLIRWTECGIIDVRIPDSGHVAPTEILKGDQSPTTNQSSYVKFIDTTRATSEDGNSARGYLVRVSRKKTVWWGALEFVAGSKPGGVHYAKFHIDFDPLDLNTNIDDLEKASTQSLDRATNTWVPATELQLATTAVKDFSDALVKRIGKTGIHTLIVKHHTSDDMTIRNVLGLEYTFSAAVLRNLRRFETPNPDPSKPKFTPIHSSSFHFLMSRWVAEDIIDWTQFKTYLEDLKEQGILTHSQEAQLNYAQLVHSYKNNVAVGGDYNKRMKFFKKRLKYHTGNKDRREEKLKKLSKDPEKNKKKIARTQKKLEKTKEFIEKYEKHIGKLQL